MFKVTVLKWNEHNPRKDFKAPRWFALNNRVLEDPDFFNFSGDEFKVWIYILCQCSQKNKGEIFLNEDHADRVCGIKKKNLNLALKKLQDIGAITHVRATNAIVQATNSTEQDNTIHNNTEQNSTSADRTSASADTTEIFRDEILNPFLRKVPITVQGAWLSTYQDHDWIQHQLKEAVTWIHGNPTKAPKTLFAKFFSSWLSRSWEWKRKNNQRVKKTGIEEWLEDQKGKEL